MTRARTAASAVDGKPKMASVGTTTIKFRAPSNALAGTTSSAAKRKTRSDEKSDGDQGMTGTHARRKVSARANTTGSVRSDLAAMQAPSSLPECDRSRILPTIRGSDEISCYTKPSQGRSGRLVEAEPTHAAAGMSKRTLRTRSGAMSGTSSYSSVPYIRESKKTNEAGKETSRTASRTSTTKTATTKRLGGLRSRPISRGIKVSKTSPGKTAPGSQGSQKEPLSPRKVTQMPLGRNRASPVHHLSEEIEAPTLSKSPRRPPIEVLAFVDQKEMGAADSSGCIKGVCNLIAARNAATMGSPPRKPLVSPPKDSLKSPAKRIGGIVCPVSVMTPRCGQLPEIISCVSSVSTSQFLRLPASRPRSPMKDQSFQSTRTEKLDQLHKKGSLLLQSSAKKAPLREASSLMGPQTVRPTVVYETGEGDRLRIPGNDTVRQPAKDIQDDSEGLPEHLLVNPRFPADLLKNSSDCTDLTLDQPIPNSANGDLKSCMHNATASHEMHIADELGFLTDLQGSFRGSSHNLLVRHAQAPENCEWSFAKDLVVGIEASDQQAVRPDTFSKLRINNVGIAGQSSPQAKPPNDNFSESPSAAPDQNNSPCCTRRRSRRPAIGSVLASCQLDTRHSQSRMCSESSVYTKDDESNADRVLGTKTGISSPVNSTSEIGTQQLDMPFHDAQIRGNCANNLTNGIHEKKTRSRPKDDNGVKENPASHEETIKQALAIQRSPCSVDGPGPEDETSSESDQEYGDENQRPASPIVSRNMRPVFNITPSRPMPQQSFYTTTKVPLKPADDSELNLAIKRSFSAPRIKSKYSAEASETYETDSFSGRKMETEASILATDRPFMSAQGTKYSKTIVAVRQDVDPSLLQGAVVLVDVHTAEGVDASGIFVELLNTMGATCINNWDRNSDSVAAVETLERAGVTHVVFKEGSMKTMERVRESNDVIHCVGVNWVLE